MALSYLTQQISWEYKTKTKMKKKIPKINDTECQVLFCLTEGIVCVVLPKVKQKQRDLVSVLSAAKNKDQCSFVLPNWLHAPQ